MGFGWKWGYFWRVIIFGSVYKLITIPQYVVVFQRFLVFSTPYIVVRYYTEKYLFFGVKKFGQVEKNKKPASFSGVLGTAEPRNKK